MSQFYRKHLQEKLNNKEMHLEGKITRILSSLSTRDMRRLGEYVHSPYFNKNEKIIRMFELLRKKHPHFRKVDKKQLFLKTFPDKKKYSDGILRALVSDLTILTEKFLTQEVYESQTEYQDIWELEALVDRGLFPLFEKKLKQVVERQESAIQQDSDSFYLRFLLERISYRYTTSTSNRAVKSSLQDVVDNLDLYYFASKMKYAAIALNRQRIVKVPYQLHILDEILSLLNKGKYAQIPAIHLYHQLVMALKYFDEEKHFFALKESMFASENALPSYEMRQLFTALLNYSRWKINQGKLNFHQESFQIYMYLLENDVLEVNGYISYHHFRNIVRVGLEVKDYQWTGKFIHSYKSKVIPKVRENVFAFNMASLHFEKGEFDQAMDYLRDIQFSEIEFIDFYYHMYFKTLLIQTAFELDEIELVFSTLESFRMYLHRNSAIPSEFREAYSNFTKVVKKIQNKQLGKRIAGANLKKEINDMGQLVHREWLMALVDR